LPFRLDMELISRRAPTFRRSPSPISDLQMHWETKHTMHSRSDGMRRRIGCIYISSYICQTR